jgi:hypothetical protein
VTKLIAQHDTQVLGPPPPRFVIESATSGSL